MARASCYDIAKTVISHSSSDIRAKDLAFVTSLARKNFVGSGECCGAFSKQILSFAKRRRIVLTNSGGAALEIALYVMRQLRPKARYVGVSAYVCPAVISAIVREGLRPLFIDIEANSLNLDLEQARKIIDDSVLALICTNIGGFADDFAAAQNLPCALISDCAQSIGTTWDGVPLESIGDVAVLSFGPTKVITAGSGGALLLDNEVMFGCAASYSTEERTVDEYRHSGFVPTSGQHFSDLNAGLGIAQLTRLTNNIDIRRKIARRYTEVLERSSTVRLPDVRCDTVPNYYRYYFMADDAYAWVNMLRANGVDARNSISHDMSEYFAGLNHFKNLKNNLRRVVSIPIYPRLLKREIGRITNLLERGIAGDAR